MTWREIWKSTVTNLKALFGFAPPPPAPIVKRKPMALTGPIIYPDHADSATHAPQTIDLTASRSLPPPSAPLRTRKPPLVPADVALDTAAFAAMKAQMNAPRAEYLPVIVSPTPTPDITWTRQGVSQVNTPEMGPEKEPEQGEVPNESEAFGEGENYAPDKNGFTDDFTDDRINGDSFDREGGDAEDEGVALTTLLESLLFVASEPIDPRQLAQTLAQPLEIIELGLAELADYYLRSLRGLRLQRFNDKVQLVTAPIAAPFIETFLNLDNTTRLSGPALEALAVIAYRQPVTRAQIEAVRGVDCAGVLRSLVQRGLVTEMGRMEGVGRPILYGVTELFMQHFGLMEMAELPPLDETEADRLWAATVMEEQELDASSVNKPQ